MVARLLDLADQLAREGARSTALRRRAVSTAYCAVFHALAKSSAGILLLSVDRNSDIYQRVYRALDHGSFRTAFTTSRGPLKERERLQKIGELVVQLQSERHNADYMPPIKGLFPRGKVETLVSQARQAVIEIERLSSEDRVALATWLLFKSRSQ
jgi:uncharacterized protein (UPF0332 family)